MKLKEWEDVWSREEGEEEQEDEEVIREDVEEMKMSRLAQEEKTKR